MRYALLDDNGNVENVIVWDGETPYDTKGRNPRLLDDLPTDRAAEPGGRRLEDGWERAPHPDPDLDPNEQP